MDEHQGSAPCIPVWKTGVPRFDSFRTCSFNSSVIHPGIRRPWIERVYGYAAPGQFGCELWREHFERRLRYGVRKFVVTHGPDRLPRSHVDDVPSFSSFSEFLAEHGGGANIHGIML